MDLNELAKEICFREGKKVQVNIAQVKEIMRVEREIIREHQNKIMMECEKLVHSLLPQVKAIFKKVSNAPATPHTKKSVLRTKNQAAKSKLTKKKKRA